MINLSFSIGSITISPFFWSLIIASILSSFSFWRRLKEDFKEGEIFDTTLVAMAMGLIVARLVFIGLNFSQFGLSFVNWLTLRVGNNFSLAGAFLGVIIVANTKMGRLKKNKWEVLDALVLPFLYYLLLGGLGLFLKTWDYFYLFYFSTGLAGLLIFPFVKKHYRAFVWYKSGKTGFLISIFGLYTSVIFLVLAFFRTDSLYLNRLVYLIFFLFSISSLYYRSERKLEEDLSRLFKRRKK